MKKVLIIPEDFRNDESMLKPIVTAMMESIVKTKVKVDVCKDPRLQGVSQALNWEKIQWILNRYSGMIDLFLLCIDRDGDVNRRAKLNALEIKAQEYLANKYPTPNQKQFLAENAWQEIEVWVLAGLDLPKDWKWKEVRADKNPKEEYFLPFAKQRLKSSFTEARCQGRGILAEESAKNYKRIRQLCPEDIQELEKNIRQWCELSK